MAQMIAGKHVVTCPACGSAVREDLLSDHHTRCPKRPQPMIKELLSESAPGTVSEPVPAPRPNASSKPTPKTTKSAVSGAASARQPRRYELFACPHCGLRTLQRYYDRHVRNCRTQSGQRAGRAAGATPEAERSGPRTLDGYKIDTCWDCGRRICLVPDGGLFRVFDIVQSRRSAVQHQCSGSESENRRTKLTYVDPKLGVIAKANQKRGRRKS